MLNNKPAGEDPCGIPEVKSSEAEGLQLLSKTAWDCLERKEWSKIRTDLEIL